MLNASWEPLAFDLPATASRPTLVPTRRYIVGDRRRISPSRRCRCPQRTVHLSRSTSCAFVAACDCGRKLSRSKKSMTTQYDVIIIGSGAGGGTLVTSSRPLGQTDLASRARRLVAARARKLDRGGSVCQQSLRLPDIWHDKHGKAFQPGVHYFVGGATKMYGAALYRLRRKTSANVNTKTAFHQRGQSLRRDGAVLPEGRAGLPCPRRRAKTRPSRRQAGLIPYPPVRTRTAHRRSWPKTSPQPVIVRFILPAASC